MHALLSFVADEGRSKMSEDRFVDLVKVRTYTPCIHNLAFSIEGMKVALTHVCFLRNSIFLRA